RRRRAADRGAPGWPAATSGPRCRSSTARPAAASHQHFHGPTRSVHSHSLPVSKITSPGLGVDHARKPELSGDDCTVAQLAADVDDYRGGSDEIFQPTQI